MNQGINVYLPLVDRRRCLFTMGVCSVILGQLLHDGTIDGYRASEEAYLSKPKSCKKLSSRDNILNIHSMSDKFQTKIT